MKKTSKKIKLLHESLGLKTHLLFNNKKNTLKYNLPNNSAHSVCDLKTVRFVALPSNIASAITGAA